MSNDDFAPTMPGVGSGSRQLPSSWSTANRDTTCSIGAAELAASVARCPTPPARVVPNTYPIPCFVARPLYANDPSGEGLR